jgi:hypothetical protein
MDPGHLENYRLAGKAECVQSITFFKKINVQNEFIQRGVEDRTKK